jgi:hypothetical protein
MDHGTARPLLARARYDHLFAKTSPGWCHEGLAMSRGAMLDV